MSTQVQGLSDNLEEIKSRLGKLIRARRSSEFRSEPRRQNFRHLARPPAGAANPTGSSPSSSAVPSAPAPSADTLYSNGLRDITSANTICSLRIPGLPQVLRRHRPRFNAQFYLGEIYYKQSSNGEAVTDTTGAYRLSKKFKLGPARSWKAWPSSNSAENAGIRELREVVKHFPGSDEDRLARAKLKELGAAITATR